MGRITSSVAASLGSNFPIFESRYQDLFESASYGILVIDAASNRIVDVNPFIVGLLGYSREAILNKKFSDITVSQEKELPDDATVFLTKSDGAICEVELTSNVYREDGRPFIQCNVRRVTKRRQMQQALERRERFLRVVLANLTDTVVACDADGNLTLFNQSLTGTEVLDAYIPPEQWAEYFELYEPDGKTLMQMEDVPLYRALHEGVVKDVELATYGENGKMLNILTNGQALFDAEGKKAGAVVVMHDFTKRKEAELAKERAETKYRNLIEASAAIMVLREPEPPYAITYITPNVESLGYTLDDWYTHPNMKLNIVHEDDRERVRLEFALARDNELETELEYRIVSRDGVVHWWQDKGRFVFDEQGRKTGWQAVILDITATKKLEEQLQQKQKMESIGVLAGGVAHDFNNMLTAINGYSDLILRDLKEDSVLRHNVEEIRKAGERSASLTNQLLVFSRQQILQPRVIDINTVINDTLTMLERVVDESVEISAALDPDVGMVMADAGQFSQIIMNLTVNARDAMPDGGKLTIETANVFLDSVYSRTHVGLLPGRYVMIALSDTGCGISEDDKPHIFEPFFTTKDIGHGTGLGLSTVYGIVKQSGGNIEVYSEKGFGTTFKIYLPRVAMPADELDLLYNSGQMATGTETILLVEDEEPVRNLSRQILKECGYHVIEAVNGADAMAIYKAGENNIDLLVTDVVMPKMGGRALAEILTSELPDLAVLFTSGYTDDAIVRHGILEIDTNFIQKPFTPTSFTKKVREVLDLRK